MLKRCIPCCGSGRVMGGGMIMSDCDHCEGRGKVKVVEDDIGFLEEKTTVSYNEAIDRIKKETNLPDKEAKEVFDKEVKRIRKVK